MLIGTELWARWQEAVTAPRTRVSESSGYPTQRVMDEFARLGIIGAVASTSGAR
jgi:hypothetical protein